MAQSQGLYLRVGVLVVVGLALALGFVLFLTANRISGRSNVTFETYIRESVQGLEVGAPVRYRGVAIGRVTQIALVSAVYRRPEGESFVAAFQLVLVRFVVDENRLGDTPSVEEAIRLGLRVRLSTQGITGVGYLELDFIDPERFPEPEIPWEPLYPYVPAIPSNLAQVTSAAENLLQRLQDVDLPSLVANLGGLVSDLREEVKDGDLAQVLREAAALLRTARSTIEASEVPALAAEYRALGTELRGATDEARGTLGEARALLAARELRQILANLATATADLRAATQRLPSTLTAVDQGARAVRGTTVDLQAELAPVMRDLRAILSNLRETTEQLRRYPSQTIFGAPPPAPAQPGGGAGR